MDHAPMGRPDHDGEEAFTDASNPLVSGHGRVGKADTAYLFRSHLKERVQMKGGIEQRADTPFTPERLEVQAVAFAGVWNMPKEQAGRGDRPLRLEPRRTNEQCLQDFADATDTVVGLSTVTYPFSLGRCRQVMHMRLASSDAFIPG
jgi:hypothetical protein